MTAVPHSLYLFTNRNAMVFDRSGSQVLWAQRAVTSYDLDAEKARCVLDSCEEFYVSRFRQWCHEVSRKEIEYLLGMRTREMDTEEVRREMREEEAEG